MPEFNSLSEMNDYVGSKISNIMKTSVGKYVYRVVRTFLWGSVYVRPAYEYERTFDLLNSLTIGDIENDGKIISCSVYFDPKKIRPSVSESEYWNHHMSVFWYTVDKKYRRPINEMIPFYMEYGTNSPIYSRPEGRFMRDAAESLNSGRLREELKKRLAQAGIQVV